MKSFPSLDTTLLSPTVNQKRCLEEDECSECSTIAVAPLSKKRRLSVKVRFDESSNQVFGSDRNDEKHQLVPENQWFNREDYTSFKRSALAIIQGSKGEGAHCDDGSLTFSGIVQTIHKACTLMDTEKCVLSPSEESALNKLFVIGDMNFVGLEREIVRPIAKQRSGKRHALYQAIRTIADPAELQARCTHISKPSALFAQCLAQASRACLE